MLYIVLPQYVFEKIDNEVLYDDSIILNYKWDELLKVNSDPLEYKLEKYTERARNKSLMRIEKSKSL